MTLSRSQKEALESLENDAHSFLTGPAGSGKSFVIREFLKNKNRARFPVLASTGAAAILVGGRTFHSFFGIGILEGGPEETIARALKNKRLEKRLKETEGVIIDEVSMLSGTVLSTAEQVARAILEIDEPWGGLKIIAVGDFAQLPPVSPFQGNRDWGFLHPVWLKTGFQTLELQENHRSQDAEFLKILAQIRKGQTSQDVQNFLNSRMLPTSEKSFTGTRLFGRREEVESMNLKNLEHIDEPPLTFPTQYSGKEKEVERFKKMAPVPELLVLKKGALIMLRQNDMEGRWVNGSLGTIQGFDDEVLGVELLNGKEVEVERTDFTLLDAEGKPTVTASNFPVNLAWAVTIHKAQGTTLDLVEVDLQRLWEPGQAYVALSRVTSPTGLFVRRWTPQSIKTDAEVARFYGWEKTHPYSSTSI